MAAAPTWTTKPISPIRTPGVHTSLEVEYSQRSHDRHHHRGHVLYCRPIKILREYDRGVIFRLGRVLPQPKGPGIILVFAPIDRMACIAVRVETPEVPPQDVVTRDNVPVEVNGVIYFRVIDPTKAVVELVNFLYDTSQLAQTTLRSVLGEVELDVLLSPAERTECPLAVYLGPAHVALGHQGGDGRGKTGRTG